MLDRRHVLLLGVLAAVSTVVPVMAADPAARTFLTTIYNSYKGKSGNGVALSRCRCELDRSVATGDPDNRGGSERFSVEQDHDESL